MTSTVITVAARFAKSALSGLLGLIKAYPWLVACIVLVLACWHLWGAKSEAIMQRDAVKAALKSEKDGRRADQANWARQVATAHAAKEAAERKFKEIADDAQASHQTLAADNAGLRRYIAARQLRAGRGATAAARPADDLGTAVLAEAPAGAVVAADAADLVSCDSAYVYAASAYQWAQGLITQGLAEPVGPSQ